MEESLDNFAETRLLNEEKRMIKSFDEIMQRPVGFRRKVVRDQDTATAEPKSRRETGVLRCTFAYEYSEMIQ